MKALRKEAHGRLLCKRLLRTLCILTKGQVRARQGTRGLLLIDRRPEKEILTQDTFEQTAKKVVSHIIRKLSDRIQAMPESFSSMKIKKTDVPCRIGEAKIMQKGKA